MNNTPDKKQEDAKLLNNLVKSIAGLVGVVVLLVGLVLALTFLPEISSSLESTSAESPDGTGASQTGSVLQLLDGKDVETGLIAGEGLELVIGNCTACHSSALILQNRFTREVWHEKIIWMQETQGLWDLGTNESAILDYLAENYAPEAPKGRRMPLGNIEWYELKE